MFDRLRAGNGSKFENRVFAVMVMTIGSFLVLATILEIASYTRPIAAPLAIIPFMIGSITVLSYAIIKDSDFFVPDKERRILLAALSLSAIILWTL
jgi:hypothetical protein